MMIQNAETWFLDPTLSPRSSGQCLTVGEFIFVFRYMSEVLWSVVDGILYTLVFRITRTNFDDHLVIALTHSSYLVILFSLLFFDCGIRVSIYDFTTLLSIVSVLFHLLYSYIATFLDYAPYIQLWLFVFQGILLCWKILAHPRMRALVPIMHIAFRKLVLQTAVLALVCYRVVQLSEHTEITVFMIGACAFLVACIFISTIVDARSEQVPFIRFIDIIPDRRLPVEAFIGFKFAWRFYRIVGVSLVTLERAVHSTGLAPHDLLTRDYFIELFGDEKGPKVFDLMVQFAAEGLGRSEVANTQQNSTAADFSISNSYRPMA